jgi:hypothetical protein
VVEAVRWEKEVEGMDLERGIYSAGVFRNPHADKMLWHAEPARCCGMNITRSPCANTPLAPHWLISRKNRVDPSIGNVTVFNEPTIDAVFVTGP